MNRRAALLLATALAVGAGGARAQTPSWTVDSAASSLGFRVLVDGSPLDGTFRRWDAQIAFDPAHPESARIEATIETGSATTGDGTHAEAMPSSDWFAVKLFPRATFVSRRVRATGANSYVADGDLTLRGVKRPAQLPFTLTVAGQVATAKGTLTLDRTAFGVGQGIFATGDMVDTKVTVTVALTARRS